jgi:hypothetical protein
MTLPAVLSPEAEADLVEAAAWHERQSEGLGKELVAEARCLFIPLGRPFRPSSSYNAKQGGTAMTALLQQAFAEAAKLPEPEQEVLASRLLAELAGEDDFDRAISRTSEKLAALAREAITEHRSGQTEPLVPERL